MPGGRRAAGWALAGAMTLAALAGGLARPPLGEVQPRARLGQPAPDIGGGHWLDGTPRSLAALRGRVVLVEFWTYG